MTYRLTFPLTSWEIGPLYRKVGCKECRHIGYAGRLGIYELLLTDNNIRQLSHDRASTWLIKKAAMQQGMITLREDGWRKAIHGKTTVDEVLRVTKGDQDLANWRRSRTASGAWNQRWAERGGRRRHGAGWITCIVRRPVNDVGSRMVRRKRCDERLARSVGTMFDNRSCHYDIPFCRSTACAIHSKTYPQVRARPCLTLHM